MIEASSRLHCIQLAEKWTVGIGDGDGNGDGNGDGDDSNYTLLMRFFGSIDAIVSDVGWWISNRGFLMQGHMVLEVDVITMGDGDGPTRTVSFIVSA